MSGKIIYIISIIVLIIVLGYAGSLLMNHQEVISPRIVPIPASLPTIIATKTFPFEKGQITISVPVNASVYEGAKRSDKTVRIIGNVSDGVWISDSYRAMVNDPNQEELYRDLIAEFRNVKTRDGLSDDEYLELMAAYTQSLQYETIGENPAKFPIETVVDGAGDCDDKSLLLAGLLSREGYRVALLSFGPEQHMALGVGSSEYHYQNTNYTFLETTNLSYVGITPEKMGGGSVLSSLPIVITIGEGTKLYTSTFQTQYLQETKILSEKKVKEIEPQVKTLQTELNEQQQAILQLENRMQELKRAGNVRDYNSLVSIHNEKVSDYNAIREKYKVVFDQYEKYALVYNYIIDHQYDRKGVYEYAKAIIPA
jgi:hypothetical protein